MLRGKSVSSSDVATQLNQLYDDYWEFILKEYPLSATYLGDHRYDGSLEDASEDAFHRRVAQSKKYLDQLRSIKKPSSKPELLNYELFERELEDNLEAAKFRPYLTPMTQQSVVDTGIHHKRWTRERSIRFFLENTALSELNITSEVDRYIAWPGQALAYKIGQLKISELRSSAEKTLGPRFDIRKFHDELLGDGALSLDVLENKMQNWVTRESAGTGPDVE